MDIIRAKRCLNVLDYGVTLKSVKRTAAHFVEMKGIYFVIVESGRDAIETSQAAAEFDAQITQFLNYEITQSL
jgi:hypothetical protein